jgi:LuxR family maltose regulon positive regulatory protein
MSTAERFAHTKIQPPRLRRGLVDRPRLTGPLLDALQRQRLVLLIAPAGFGKTAALTQAIAALPSDTAVAWISADAEDDLGRFAACLVAALDPIDLPWRSSPDALVAALDDGRQTHTAVASELLNALLAAEVPRGLIVIEDAHRIEDPAVFEFIDLLVERLPEHWGCVIASRVDPPFPLARWRARAELAEFRQEQLRFSDAEVAALTGAAPGPVDAETRVLLERSQGWAAGLRLVLGGARGGGAPRAGSSQRHLFDYLASEVLDNMPAELRDFLLRCSVLHELSAARCAAVSGDPRAAVWLEMIEQRGLFVSVLDEREPLLRLHDLFRDFLDDRLRRDLPGELPELLRRAAVSEPDPTRRLGHLVQAGAWDDAERLLAEIGPGLVAAGAVAQVLRLIDLFPAARRDVSPWVAHVRGLCAWAQRDIVTMLAALERAAAGYASAGEADAAQHARVLAVLGLTSGGQVATAVERLAEVRARPMDLYTETTAWQAESWHAFALGRMRDVGAPLVRMAELLERSSDPLLWIQCAPPTSFIGLPGARPAMQRYVDGALARTQSETPTPLRVLADTLRAGTALWSGRLDEAEALLRQAAADSRWLKDPAGLAGPRHTYGALTRAVRGDAAAALADADARLQALVDSRTSGRRSVWLNHCLYFKLRVAAILDDAATVRSVAAELEGHADPGENAMLVLERAALPARLAEADGDWDAAAAAYARALDDELALAPYGQAREVRVRLAHALLRSGRVEAAARALTLVFERVHSHGDLGGVLFAGRRALDALAGAPWQKHLAPAQVAAVRHWASVPGRTRPTGPTAPAPAAAPAPTPAAAHAPAAAVAPSIAASVAASVPGGGGPARPPPPARGADTALLSSRELEVLARLAAGDSNKLIARAFDLSPHTVKRHVANILDKLALESRGQAAAWHRAHSPR